MTKINAYVICFKEDTARRDVIKKRFKAYGITPDFIDAVRGSALTDQEKSLFNQKSRAKRIDHLMKDNAIGCALSHHKAWQAIIDSGAGYGFVFEDDAIANDIATTQGDVLPVMQAMVQLSSRLDIVTLANRRQKLKKQKIRPLEKGYDLCLLNGNDIGAESYFISADAAARMLNHHHLHDDEVDVLIHHWWHHDCQVLHLQPSLFAEEGRPTSIGYDGKTPWADDSISTKLGRRFARIHDSITKRRRHKMRLRHGENRLDERCRKVLVIQPMVGIGDMVWHKPWLDEVITRHDVTLMAKPSAQAKTVLADHGQLPVIPLLRSERGRRGQHDGLLGFFRMVSAMKSCGADHVWVLHRSWRYAAAAWLAGIRYRSGYGTGNQQWFLNDSMPLDKAMKKAHPRVSVNAFLLRKGIAPDDTHPRMTPLPDAVVRAAEIVPQSSPLIICGVGAADAIRRWSPERFADLVDRLSISHPDHVVALCGSPAEAEIGSAIINALSPETKPPVMVFDQPLDTVIALHHQAVLYIGNDTSLINIAAAVGTPSIRVFASNLSVLESPLIETVWPSNPDRIDVPGAINDIDAADVAALAKQKL